MPKVSILVPIYNVESFLTECLDSVVNQTLKDIEIICLNDGSTDKSLDIVQQFAQRDQRIKIVDKPNSGYGHTMNVGLKQATGVYIGIVESDDYAAPEMFEKLYEAAEHHEADVVMSNFIEFNNRLRTERFVENLKDCRYNNVITALDIPQLFFTTSTVWGGIYKRSFLAYHQILFHETPGASYQDLSFAFKVWATAEKVFLMKDAFLHYRRDNMDSSVNSGAKVFCVCDEYEEIDRFLEGYPSVKSQLTSLIFAKKFKTFLWNYNRLGPAYQYAFLLKMREQFLEGEAQGLVDTQFLTASECEVVSSIIYSPELYFIETAKSYRDERLSLGTTLNSQILKQGLLVTIKKYKGIVIYGAGILGKRIAQKLIYEENINHIVGFAVTDRLNNPDSLFGLPVVLTQDLNQYADDYIILIAVKEQYQYEIIRSLKNLNFSHIVALDSNMVAALS